MLKHSRYFYFSALAIGLIAFSGNNLATASTKSAVKDSGGHVVKSITSGSCARTKWEKEQDECAANKIPAIQEIGYQPITSERSYIIFYDFAQSRITQQAKVLINSLVNNIDDIRQAKFTLVGHTDRSGSNGFNDILSKKRTLAAVKYLESLGVERSHITTSWKGETSPLIPTNDGIREAQNRRTEIFVQLEK